jgi:N-acetylglucosaminyldiphosphoundecaprenol N-acetyl-beta-D-mannosaminyltransferase
MDVEILGVRTCAQTFEDALSMLLGWAEDAQGRRSVCTAPVYTVMMCAEDPAVMRAVNGADMVAADGMPIVWLQRQRYPAAERVYGPDVLLALTERTAASGVSHYFYGGQSGVAQALADRLRQRFPSVAIAGAYTPPVAPFSAQPDRHAIALLNDSGASVVWVGLGSPKQDLWMALHRPLLHAPLLIGVGAAFDMLAGVKAQAPRWMQRSGLEWLFRLLQEPRRLGRRYLYYNPLFIWRVLRQQK